MNIDVIEQAKEKSIQKFADTITDGIIVNTLVELETVGIEIDNDQFHRDYCLAINFLRASIYRTLELDHPVHSLIEENNEIFSSMLDKKE
jgi:hypothetical protein